MSQHPSGSTNENAGEVCPGCGVILDVADESRFALVRCPQCRAEVRVKSRVGPFLLQEVIGQGGSGRVFRAIRPVESSGEAGPPRTEEVALKILERNHPDYGEHLSQLRNEAKCSRLIRHPRVVKVLSMTDDDSGATLALELMEGGSLHDLIVSNGALGEVRVLQVGLEILKALAAAHDKGIIHRDLKPANILLGASGGAKLGDFGLARSNAEKPVPEPHLLATPDYVAPEMLAGFYGDLRSDVYSLGGCLYHALLGVPPYRTDGLSIQELRTLKALPVSFGDRKISRSTRSLIRRMSDPEPSRRFGSHGELESAILIALAGVEGRGIRSRHRKRHGGLPGKLLGWWKSKSRFGEDACPPS